MSGRPIKRTLRGRSCQHLWSVSDCRHLRGARSGTVVYRQVRL